MIILWKKVHLNIGLFAFVCIFNLTLSSEVLLQNNSSIRLPTFIQPIKYNLHINSSIHEDILVFNGNVVIEFVVKESTSEIVLHAKELRDFKINLKDVRNRGRRRFDNLKYSLETEKDFLRISLPQKLQNGERYRLEISYLGKIQKEFYGLYRTTYLDEYYNKSIPLAVTQFEPTNARLAFPCFDEPSFRAKFVITITHGSFYTALSNMPIDGQPSWANNMVTTKFRETPIMPTYLVGFVICNFDHISQPVNGVEHRIFFPPNAKDFGARAITNSIQSVAFLENYLGIQYSLPKLDHIHVKDIDLVAMDWGLAIYNDKEFLTTLEHRDKTVDRIILQNYLISQQWFSNMIPLKWWSYAWVNSGLATYFSYKMTDLIYPTWKMEEYFILNEVHELLKLDLDEPLIRNVDTQADIDQLNSDDKICQIGACVIKMFHHAIGNETFIKGLRYYFQKFTNSVTDEDDFFGAIESAISDDYLYLFQIDKSLHEIMKTWTNNPGIPKVKVTRHNGTVTIQQRPFNGNSHEKWWIPLNFATPTNGNFERTTADYIMPPVAEVTINLEEINVSLMISDWLIVNKQQTGLYYVVYDDQNLELIADALNADHTTVHKLNRALLFRDFKATLDTDLGDVKRLLNSLKYLKNEEDSLPWFEAAELLDELWTRLKGGKAYELFKTFIHDIIGNFYRKFSEIPLYKLSFADSNIKKSIYKLACEVELNECLASARHQTKEYLFYNWPMDESLKVFTMCKAMASIQTDELREILEKILYPRLSWVQEKDFLHSLECVKSEEKFDLILEFVLEGEKNVKKMSITNYMSIYHASFGEKLRQLNKRRQRRASEYRFVSKETTQKREEFRRKYEDNIYDWLENYKFSSTQAIRRD